MIKEGRFIVEELNGEVYKRVNKVWKGKSSVCLCVNEISSREEDEERLITLGTIKEVIIYNLDRKEYYIISNYIHKIYSRSEVRTYADNRQERMPDCKLMYVNDKVNIRLANKELFLT